MTLTINLQFWQQNAKHLSAAQGAVQVYIDGPQAEGGAMPVEMGVDFFLAELPVAERLQEIIMSVQRRGLAEREYELREDQVVRLEDAHSGWQHCVEGEMARLRFSSLPEKGARGRRLEALGLPPEAGVGDRSAFLYDTRSRVLLLQRNRFAIGSTGFANYLNAQTQGADKVQFQPVLTQDAYRKLADMPDIRRLEISLAAPRNVGELFRGESAIGPILNARDALQAPVAQFVFAAAPRGESLPRRMVMQTVRDVLRMRDEDERSVRKVKVVAREPNEEPLLLDLITERLQDSEVVEPARERTVPYDRRRTALRQVWHRHHDEIRRMFAHPEGAQR